MNKSVKALPQITLSEVAEKDLKIVVYLTLSGGLGYLLALLAKDPALTAVFAPVINFVLFRLEKELTNSGYIRALKN